MVFNSGLAVLERSKLFNCGASGVEAALGGRAYFDNWCVFVFELVSTNAAQCRAVQRVVWQQTERRICWQQLAHGLRKLPGPRSITRNVSNPALWRCCSCVAIG